MTDDNIFYPYKSEQALFILEAIHNGDHYFIAEDGRYCWIAEGVPIPDSWGKVKEISKMDFYFSYMEECEKINRPLKLRGVSQLRLPEINTSYDNKEIETFENKSNSHFPVWWSNDFLTVPLPNFN